MRYPIDVAFVRKDGIIVRLVTPLQPWRLSGCRTAHSVLELKAGLARRLRLAVGRHAALGERRAGTHPFICRDTE